MPTPDENAEKKQIIAEKMLEYFLKHGMVKTIVNDVAKDLHMSKKTIYKYFHGGKSECLYFIYFNLAKKSCDLIQRQMESNSSPHQQIEHIIDNIFETAVPYVLGNAATKEEDYLVENQIVGQAFRDAYRPLIVHIIEEGKKLGDFSFDESELTFIAIYGIIFESMAKIHQHQDNYTRKSIRNQIKTLILKMLS